MTDPDPTLRPEPLAEDDGPALRPQTLDAFTGQAEARANLGVFIESAKMRGKAMDHASVQTVVTAMSTHKQDPNIVKYGLEVFANMFDAENSLDDEMDNGIIQFINFI